VDADGKLRHSCFLGTATGRNAHVKPNLAQVPHESEFRSLFTASPGNVIVAADCSQLELRCLAHYLHRYDGGAFAKVLLEGDVHQMMADISGVDRRTQKTITYALIYGAGNWRLGLSAGVKDKEEATKRGAQIRHDLLKGIPGLDDLIKAIKKRARTGELRGLDGRPIRIKSEHSAFNYLLQSAGAIICKNWVVQSKRNASAIGLAYSPLEFVHDEQAWDLKEAYNEERAPWCLTTAITQVERKLNFRVPLAVDVKVGRTWAEVH